MRRVFLRMTFWNPSSPKTKPDPFFPMRPFTKALARFFAASSLLVISGCVIAIGGGGSWWGQGSSLPHKHTQSLALPSGMDRLNIEVGSGCIQARPSDGEAHLTATIYEQKAGDGYVVLENGDLIVRSHSGRKVALGDVSIYLAGETRELLLDTGSGDICAEDLVVSSRLSASTGSGSAEVREIGGNPKQIELSTGSGNVYAASFSSEKLIVDTGSGNVDVRDVTVQVGSFDTGSGSVRLASSRIEAAFADTGSGNIDARGSHLGQRTFSTGSGSVRVDG